MVKVVAALILHNLTLLSLKMVVTRLYFWETVCKTVCFVLSDRCLSVCVSCLLVALMYCSQTVGWINETWYEGRPQPRRHCVRWGHSSPSRKGHSSPRFSAHVYCGQTVGWIKIPVGREVELGSGHIVLDGVQLSPKKGTQHAAPHFSAHVCYGQTVAYLS